MLSKIKRPQLLQVWSLDQPLGHQPRSWLEMQNPQLSQACCVKVCVLTRPPPILGVH